jgi:5-hydroxyisourate hydrolase
MTSHVTTHVLDAVTGTPARGIGVRLLRHSASVQEEIGAGRTDADGRNRTLGPERLPAGTYRLVFGTGEYFRSQGRETFYPEVTIDFTVREEDRATYHVPILLSPFAYSTYRGS